MSNEFFCKLCWKPHHIRELYEDSDPARLQCKDSVKRIEERKKESKKIKSVSKADMEKLLNQRADKRRKIESILEQRQLEKSLNNYEI